MFSIFTKNITSDGGIQGYQAQLRGKLKGRSRLVAIGPKALERGTFTTHWFHPRQTELAEKHDGFIEFGIPVILLKFLR
jgi:hypothetical protein